MGKLNFSGLSLLFIRTDEEAMGRVKTHDDPRAFAKGSVNFDDFATRATINGYAGTGQGVTSAFSWIAY